MLICVDFDGTIVDDTRVFEDVLTPLELLPGALEALQSLKRAGHVLVLYSSRANRSLREDAMLDPLVRSGIKPRDHGRWEKMRRIHQARYDQMLRFVEQELPGIFDAIDDGRQGKPDADLFIDDRALRVNRYGGRGVAWEEISHQYGE